ncbi:unknown protein [Oryza sativa Japonica Group]|uniref:cDNA clone:001-122-E11, full insert sequence n=1 Tax=Oryza sativa subsp. japonica TaxID=39947 RepID=Q5VP29_ORYSJ|nr:unknown protein [Oryza sativa Japonica Group]BAG88898.1 unnamed protein product [Oryza sativa Japonica Group]
MNWKIYGSFILMWPSSMPITMELLWESSFPLNNLELRILWQLAVVEEDLMVYLKLQDVDMVNTRCAMTLNCMGHGMTIIHQKLCLRPLQLACYGVHTHKLHSRAHKLQSSVLLLNTRSSMICSCDYIFVIFIECMCG